MQLGNKILVVGVLAAGKTTFARTLAEKTNLTLHIMDAIMWRPGWQYIGDDATNSRLKELATGESWIIEGYVTRASRAHLFEVADTVIYLSYPWHTAAYRYIKRWLHHRRQARQELPGSPEQFNPQFLSVIWSKGELASLEDWAQTPDGREKLIRLSSPKAARQFLENIS